MWLQSQTKLVETLCPKGSDLSCFANLKKCKKKLSFSHCPSICIQRFFHWLSCYCVPVKKQQAPPTLNGGRRGGEWIVLFSEVMAAQHRVATLFQHGFKWLPHCSNIAMLCCTKNQIVPCNIIFKGTTSFWWVLHIYFLNHAVCILRVLIWWFISLILHWRPWMTGALNNMERYIYPKIRKITV